MKKILYTISLLLVISVCSAQVGKSSSTHDKTAQKKTDTTSKAKNKTTTASTGVKMNYYKFPHAVKNNISKTYPGYKPVEAYKKVNGSLTTYQVVMKKGSSKMNLYYDNDFKFLKKEVAVEKPAVSKSGKSK